MKKILVVVTLIIAMGLGAYVLLNFNKKSDVYEYPIETLSDVNIEDLNNAINTGSDLVNTPNDQSVFDGKITQTKDYSMLCKNDDICKKYYEIWKSEQMSRNGYNADYFNKHIVPESMEISKWNDGESFYVIYNVVVDWATAKTYDTFIVKTNPGDKTYPTLKIPRGQYLTKNEIDLVINAGAYNSHFSTIKPSNQLAYKTKQDAMSAIFKQGGSQKFELIGDSFFSFANGQITMTAVDLTNCDINNSNKKVILNLITGGATLSGDACRVY